MLKTQYGYQITTDLSYDDAIAKATEELKKEGFGILTEIDVSKTLKQKIDLDFRRYIILGACNPHFASQMLQEEIEIGLLMPCNVIVYEGDDKQTVVSFLSPKTMLEITGRDDLKSVADQVEEIIARVAAAM